MGVLWSAVYGWELAVLPTLPGWDQVAVYDGPPVTGDAVDRYAIVGWVNDEQAGTWQTIRAPSGGETIEQGDVRSQLVCQTGDVDLPTVRAQSFALIDVLAELVAADYTLGGTLPGQAECSLACTVESVQNARGSAQTITFALHYYAIR